MRRPNPRQNERTARLFAVVVHQDEERARPLAPRVPWNAAIERAEKEMQKGAWAVGVYRAVPTQDGQAEIGYLAQTYWRDAETREIRCMIHAVELSRVSRDGSTPNETTRNKNRD